LKQKNELSPTELSKNGSASTNHRTEVGTSKASRRVKLVLLIRDLRVGGAERQLVALAKSLDPEIFDVSVVCLYDQGVFTKELLESRVHIATLGKQGRYDIPRFFWRFRKLLRDLRPDIVHSYLPVQNLLTLFARTAVPSARVVWGIRGSNTAPIRDWLARPVERMQALFSNVPDLTIFNSNAGREYHLSRGYTSSRTVVIPNGIDTKRFAPDRASGLKMRALWQIPEDSLLIGIVGRLDPMKDHPTFLRAAASFARLRPDARYVCVGAGQEAYSQHLRELAMELDLTDKVLWTGALDDVSSAYNALDICCSASSHGEGTSNSVSEAMACGVPCVVTNVGDSPLIVGETGIVVPPRNPEALAAGWAEMARLISEESRLSEVVRRRIASQLSMSTLVDNTSTALLNLL
jgi:glycosyltransferase involved in cell wall biosynthesis